jgi:putative membrane protein
MSTRAQFFAPRPLFWIVFSIAVLAVPLVGLALESDMTFTELLPTINASLNATSAVFLFAGWRAIKAKKVSLHWKCMIGAVAASTLFLAFYLTRFALTGTHRYPIQDWTRTLYLVVLGSHTILAASVPFLVAITLWFAKQKRFERHRRIARWTLPIWGYVSVTGVVVYVMLYHLPGWLGGATP